MSVSVLEKIEQYQKSIEKYHGNEEKLLYYIKKLSQLPVTVAHLQETGVGRTINSLRKSNGDVRAAAKSLVSKWKHMVAAEEAEGEEEVENRPEEMAPERKYASPDGSALKRHVADNLTDHLEKKKRRDTSPDDDSHRDLGQSSNFQHHRERKDDRRYDRSLEKKTLYSSYVTENIPRSPETTYANGHYSDNESDNEELRIEDDVPDEESQSASDVESSEQIQGGMSQDSNYTAQHSSDGEPTKKASSSKSHSHKDSKHRESSRHHQDQKDKSSRKERSSSSHKSKDEKKEKSEKSHRKHEKHKSKESSREEEGKKSPRKSHHSSSSERKMKEKESRLKQNSEKQSPVKSKSEGKIKQEPVDPYEVKIKQEPVDTHSSPEKADKSEIKKSSSSSSSSKSEKHKDKRKSSDKDRKKEKDESKSSQKEKRKDLEDEGVDSFSGASFGDVLGMIGPTKSSKKKSLSSPSTSKGVAGYDPLRPDLNYEKGRIKPEKDLLDSPSEDENYNYNSLRPSAIEDDLLLPEISPHYKPLPQPNYSISPTKRHETEEEALSRIISTKPKWTKVYSGNKSGYTYVPSLFEICTRVLQDNIEALGYTGGVPFDLLKPVLEHATADELYRLEDHNPYLIEDTDAIWQLHCQKDFRNKKREEMETWREMYLRCIDERERKLKSLTSSIQNSQSKLTPVRKTKLAYVEGTVKPPRGIARKQAKYGSALPQPKSSASTSKSSSFSPKPSTSSTSSSSTTTTSSSFGGRQSVLPAPTVSVPNPRAGSSHSSGSLKPKPKAPLMQKALQLVRNRFKR